jgi:hypothetical protein
MCSLLYPLTVVLEHSLSGTVVDKRATKTGVTSGAVTTYPSEAPEFIPVICGVRVAQSSVFCVILCWSLCALFVLCLMPLYWLSFVLCHCIDCPLSFAIVLTVLCLMPLYWLSFVLCHCIDCPLSYAIVLTVLFRSSGFDIFFDIFTRIFQIYKKQFL